MISYVLYNGFGIFIFATGVSRKSMNEGSLQNILLLERVGAPCCNFCI